MHTLIKKRSNALCATGDYKNEITYQQAEVTLGKVECGEMNGYTTGECGN